MRAQILPAVGFYTDANRHWSTQDCLNWLPVRAERPGTRTQYQLRQCPGLRPFVRTTETGVGRGVYNIEGKLLSVVGSNLYQISNTGVAIPRGTIPGVRRVSMAHNQHGSSNQVSIANGSAGYIYDTSATTLTKITDDGFPGAMLTFFVDGYLGYIDPQGIYWGHSDLNDGLSYNALDSYEAEGLPDRIVSGLVSHREVLIFGTDSTEPYVNSPSGDGTAPFQRASNTVIETGCAATFSPVKLGDLVVFLDQCRRVCVLNGYTAVPISTAAIDQAFGECTEAEVKQAWAFGWQDRGHIVYYITVPGRFTFGYDFTHKEWHRRATNGLPHWAVSGVAKWNGKVIAQDSRNGDLYELRWEYARDANNSELIREYSPGSLNAGRSHICVNRVSLEFGVRESEGSIDFPAQPNGPSISGDAPDGAVDYAYPGYAYAVTAGDSPIVSVKVISGSLPPGLTLSNSGVLSASTPTTIGSFAFTILVTDANGLTAEISDTIEIKEIWFDVQLYTGTGAALGSFNSLDLSAGGFVLVTRLDAAETPMIYYKTGAASSIMQMPNITDLAAPAENPTVSTATFGSNKTIQVPMNTSGGSYIAYVAKKSAGNFNILEYVGNGVAGHQVAHGLGAVPKMHTTRPIDDSDYTIGFLHLQQFNGLQFLQFGSGNNVETSDQEWNNTAPDATNVTLGWHPRLNGNGKNYVMFLFGGPDVYAGTHHTTTDISIGFDPQFMLVKRRSVAPYNFQAYSTATNANFSGADTGAVINGSGGVAEVIDRITKLSSGHYQIEQTDVNWNADCDVLAIRHPLG